MSGAKKSTGSNVLGRNIVKMAEINSRMMANVSEANIAADRNNNNVGTLTSATIENLFSENRTSKLRKYLQEKVTRRNVQQTRETLGLPDKTSNSSSIGTRSFPRQNSQGVIMPDANMMRAYQRAQ